MNANVLDVTFWLKRFMPVGWLPVIAFLILFIDMLFQFILRVYYIEKWSITISAGNMDSLAVVRNMPIVDTWSIISIWSVELLQIVGICTETSSLVIVVDRGPGIGRNYSEISLVVNHDT